MYKLTLYLGICAAFALGRKLEIPSEDSEKMLGCYREIYAPHYNPEKESEEMGIDASLCTHLFYIIFGIGSNDSAFYDSSYSDAHSDQFKYFNGSWEKKPQIKTLAHMVDLSNEYLDHPVNVLTDPDLRGKLVNSVVKFVKKYALNGIDLDISNVQSIDGPPNAAKKNLVLLLKAIKEKFDKEGFILSVSIDPREDAANILYDIKGISTYVNFINLMAFNFNEPLYQQKKRSVSHSSPLYHSSKESAEEQKKNIDYVVTYWIRQGAPTNKLILGTTFHSQVSYTLANPKQIGTGAPFTEVKKYANAKYSDVCLHSRQPEWHYLFDKEQQVPYFYKGNQILPYEDVASVTAKAEYVKKMKLGGASVMYVDDDDFLGKCGEKFALMKTLNRVLRKKS